LTSAFSCLNRGVKVSQGVKHFAKVGVLVFTHYVRVDFAKSAVQLQLQALWSFKNNCKYAYKKISFVVEIILK